MANPEAEQIRMEYLERLRRMLRRAPADIREDAVSEVKSHIEDEWQALGGDLTALQTVLQRLGPPEEYGRDLALQLMLMGGTRRRSPARVLLAVLFWASTNLIGFVVVLCAAVVFGFAMGMVIVAVERILGNEMMLIDAVNYQFFTIHADRVRFPPETWPPVFIALVGLLPAFVIFAGLKCFLTVWVGSRLAHHGLAAVMKEQPEALPHGWERHAVLAMAAIATLGLGSCISFSILSEMVVIGHPSQLNLPTDFFRTPLNALALLGILIFLCSPVLGLLWIVRRSRG